MARDGPYFVRDSEPGFGNGSFLCCTALGGGIGSETILVRAGARLVYRGGWCVPENSCLSSAQPAGLCAQSMARNQGSLGKRVRRRDESKLGVRTELLPGRKSPVLHIREV